MSHEQRTPLNSIMGKIDFPGDLSVSDEQSEYMEIAGNPPRTFFSDQRHLVFRRSRPEKCGFNRPFRSLGGR
jgi:signal transduction histidine kinase